MLKVAAIEQMRLIEAAADASGITYETMMQNAGRATADRALNILAGLPDPRITVLVGPGNNGGDGLVAGLLIAQESKAQVRFYLFTRREKTDANYKAVLDAGVFMAYADDDKDHRVVRNMVSSADLVIDALFGIGVRLPIKGDAAKLLRSVNQALKEPPLMAAVSSTIDPTRPGQFQQAPRPYVLAVDCPTGLDCDTGALDQNAIQADETVTFIAAKLGLFVFPGAQAVGHLSIAPIGIPDDLKELQAVQCMVVDSETVRKLLPERPADSNKGTFGKVLVVAGSVNYVGAAGLAAEAAYRSGAGLVTVGAPQPVVTALAGRFTEATWLLLPHDMGVISQQAARIVVEEAPDYQAMILGPGWGREATTREFLTALLDQSEDAPRVRSRRKIGFLSSEPGAEENDQSRTASGLPPLVIDADGLNLLSEMDNWWKLVPKESILTPHPGEMARLTKTETKEVQANRWGIARDKAAEWGVILLLKGAHTLIAAPDGRVAMLPFKTDALATAGTGDVLAGIIAGLLAQGLAPFEATTAGGYLHGLAGQTAAEWGASRSVIAGDVLSALENAIEMVETI